MAILNPRRNVNLKTDIDVTTAGNEQLLFGSDSGCGRCSRSGRNFKPTKLKKLLALGAKSETHINKMIGP